MNSASTNGRTADRHARARAGHRPQIDTIRTISAAAGSSDGDRAAAGYGSGNGDPRVAAFTLRASRAALATESHPIDDIRSTAAYRAAVAANLLEAFLHSLAS